MNRVVAFLLNFGRGFLDALVFMKYWGWFVVPLGVAGISYWHAFGLSLFIEFFWFTLTANGRTVGKPNSPIFFAIVKAGFVLLFWWVGGLVQWAM